MNNIFKKAALNVSSPSRNQRSPLIYKFLYLITWTVVALAILAGAFLLVSDVFVTHLSHMPLSAAPLLLIGTAYLAFQVLIRAQLLDLFKALIVSSAFILWGIDQLLPSGWLATTLGDVVIVLYVIDLGWMMMDRLKQQWNIRHAQPEQPAYESSVLSSELDKSALLSLLHPSSSEGQQYIPQHFVASSKGNASFLKHNRLTPLPCTCASPLESLHSPMCCRAMKEASEQ